MSEVQTRGSSARGRGGRGRGGFSSRGRPAAGRSNGETAPITAPVEDEGEIGQLKKKYGSKVTMIKEMFPDWTDEDVVFALQETDGDLETTVERIADGTISQWGAVSKDSKKDRAKSKVKDATVSTFGNSNSGTAGGRSGFEGGRGRGRGTDRGRGGRGGRGTSHTNGSRKENIVPAPAVEASAWDTPADTSSSWETKPAASGEDSWGAAPATDSWGSGAIASTTAAAASVTSSIIPDGVKKSWASMFAPAPVAKKAPEPAEKPVEPTKSAEHIEIPVAEPEDPSPELAPAPVEETTPVEAPSADEPEITLTPSKDELTETNLEQVPDVSHPIESATAASTAASSWDPRNVSAGTPYAAIQSTQPQAVRPPPTSGFQATALKATGTSGRTPSYQRRVLDQEEAVRMPGNREVDRAAVQFGAFNLNGSGDEDVDGDREEPESAETRAQPPQHSPIAPRAALPPAPQQPAAVPEAFPTPKAQTGLPAATHPTAAPGLPSPQTLPGAQNGQQGPQGNGQFSQYGRYGQAGTQESSVPPKPFDAFSQQAPSTEAPFGGYPNHQTQTQSQSQQQPQTGAFSSASNDQYSQYYTSDPQRYASYYQQQGYGQHGAQGQQGQQENAAPQRSYSGYAPSSDTAASFPQSASQPPQSRLNLAGEGPASGHTTPNPASQTQPQGPSAQGGQPQPGHPQQPGSYPYGHPYYSSPYYAQYAQNNYQYGGYGGPYGAKGGAHGQAYPGYGMTPGAPYEHASSPAAGGFGGSALHGRESALGGLGDYGRAGSAQSSQTPQGLGSGAFGGSHDAFGRGSSYQGQTQQHYNGNQSSQANSGDDLKPFGDSKASNGPSPSLAQAGRPGSATNTTPGVLPPPQSQQGSYGGYPAHLQQAGQHGLHGSQAGSQYGALGAAAGHQAAGSHQSNQYGGYQAFGGQGSYYGSGQQQQQQQQRGGWGGNYGH